MQVEDKEINGFQIENFNQHGLDVGKSQGTCPLCSSSRKPEKEKQNVLAMIGNVVSALAITVINLFNYTHLNVKVKLNVIMLYLKKLLQVNLMIKL